MDYLFTMDLTVTDLQQLLAHAQAIAVKEGDDPKALCDEYGEPDVAACLVMILDPGSAPGVNIHSSKAE
ncbi:hypothetical protein [Duganella vulcania]|uniref:Uncharacterized protein n=1 Tax=Duganella vulcania TaxID=2692166 RepID=A0A845GH28_9BURK|nr:hypothetical protein [Duganella vulcania]MYM92308.1 hypothetical protein [Duganella vulcania]